MATKSLLRSSCHGGASAWGPLLKEPAGNTISGLRRWAVMGEVMTNRRGCGERREETP